MSNPSRVDADPSFVGMANYSHFSSIVLPPSNAPFSNRRYSSRANHYGLPPTAPPFCPLSSKGSSSSPLSPTLSLTSFSSQDTIGYNLAALKYVMRQHEANRTAEFYEAGGMGGGGEEEVRKKIEQGMKKRKRATLKS